MLLLVKNYIYTKDKRCYVASTDEYYLQPARINKTGRIYANPELREIYDREKLLEKEFFSKNRSPYEIWKRKRRLKRQESGR